VDFWKTLKILFSRWYIALPVFLVACAGAAAVFVTTPTYYTSTGLVLLTTPPAGGVLDPDAAHRIKLNPLLGFDDGLKITSTVLIANLNSPEVMGAIATSGPGDSLTISPPPNVDGPFILMTSVSQSPSDASMMVKRAIDRARQELYNRQSSLQAPTATFINMSEVVSPTAPAAQVKSKTRAAAVVLALGIAASLAATYGTESFLVARRRHRDATPTPEDDESAKDPEEQPEPEGQPWPAPLDSDVRESDLRETG
jgi:hypothetical protein